MRSVGIVRWRIAIAASVLVAVVASVSLSSPRGAGGGSIPTVRVGLQPGSRQIVRILLGSASDTGTIANNGTFATFRGKPYRGEIVVVPSDSGRLVVNRLPMDSYLRGVVPLEIGNRTAAEFAAVEAQAVAARTYSYKHLNESRAFDMYATVQDQVYGGVDAEKPQSDSAVATTADVVVLYNGRPITTPYHSTCGGSTAAVTEV